MRPPVPPAENCLFGGGFSVEGGEEGKHAEGGRNHGLLMRDCGEEGGAIEQKGGTWRGRATRTA